jgi:hypothetical protein
VGLGRRGRRGRHRASATPAPARAPPASAGSCTTPTGSTPRSSA